MCSDLTVITGSGLWTRRINLLEFHSLLLGSGEPAVPLTAPKVPAPSPFPPIGEGKPGPSSFSVPAVPCRTSPDLAVPRLPRHAAPHPALPIRTAPRLPCHAKPCRTRPRLASPAMPRLAKPCPAQPSRAVPCLPGLAVPRLAMPA